MKLRFTALLLHIILAVVFLGCKKSDVTPLLDDSVIKNVRQVTATSTDFVTYEYDALGNVTKYVSQWANSPGTIQRLNNVYEYNGNKLIRFSNEAGYGLFHYTGNVLEKSDHFTNNDRKISSYLYQYDAAGKITSVVEQIANPLPDGASETKINYQYYGDGNVSRIDYFIRQNTSEPFKLSLSKVFAQYDDKKNPEPAGVAGFFLPGILLQKNNPIKINNLGADGTVEGYSRNEYTYNSSGYPITRKQFIATKAGEVAPLLFTYTY